MVAGVLAANAGGLHTTARLQLGLAAALATLLLVAVVTALPEGQAAHWTPFAPHGWTGIGAAASLLMFSFIGWEAGSHLVGDFRDPARQLPRALLGRAGDRGRPLPRPRRRDRRACWGPRRRPTCRSPT